MRKEINPILAFSEKINATVKSLNEVLSWGNATFCVSRQSSEILDIPSNSIDYIFTDPPYADTMPYADLNFIWDAWLTMSVEHKTHEVIGEDWLPRMRTIFKELNRVLKPGGFCSVCYHDTSEGTWGDLMDVMAEAGFENRVSKEPLYIETTQRAFQQTVADKVVKRDHVVNFRKPNGNSEPIKSAARIGSGSIQNAVGTAIRLVLSDTPGLTKDRIYDFVINRLLLTGEIDRHNFEEILSNVAIESREPVKKSLFDNEDPNIFGTHEISRWYLKETELAITDTAETEKEEEGARQISSFIVKQIKTIHRDAEVEKSTSMQGLSNSPDQIGIHYSDIFEHYIYAVKDKPRRQLSEWLLDYFYKTDEGTYRLPATEEEAAAKSEGRSKGTNRRVKRYLALLEQGAKIPGTELPNDATLCEWIRHCKRAGSFEQGKILYEKGGLQLDSLNEEQQVEVEEDYQVCVRMLSRETKDDSGKVKRKTRKKA